MLGADGVDQDVELAVGCFELLEDAVDFGVMGDVAAEYLHRPQAVGGQPGGEFFCFTLQALGLVADGERGAGLGETLADAPGDAALVGEAEDDGDFAG
jgi:hypothetical protein